jgi:hypothetical protein
MEVGCVEQEVLKFPSSPRRPLRLAKTVDETEKPLPAFLLIPQPAEAEPILRRVKKTLLAFVPSIKLPEKRRTRMKIERLKRFMISLNAGFIVRCVLNKYCEKGATRRAI